MPKVNPETGEPMSDAPEGDDVTRGGKGVGDPALEGATETGRQGVGYSDTGSNPDTGSRELVGEKGGAATGGGA
jgi:hypothetical protein